MRWTVAGGFHLFHGGNRILGPMESPNLMVEISASELGDLITALTFHVGEVKRNPYHLSLPAWMMDNVRRGGEWSGGRAGRRRTSCLPRCIAFAAGAAGSWNRFMSAENISTPRLIQRPCFEPRMTRMTRGGERRSAEMQLLYRRFVIGWASDFTRGELRRSAEFNSAIQQSATLRYACGRSSSV